MICRSKEEMMGLKTFSYLLILCAAAFLVAQAPQADAKGKKKKSAKKAKVEKKKAGEEKEAAAEEEVKDPKKAAKAAYKKGKELYDEGKYQESLDSFMVAYNSMPNPFVYISIAQCYDKLGKCQEARDYYLKYIKEKPDAGNIPDIQEKVEELESRSGKVAIHSDPEGASITIDGETTDKVTPAEFELKGGDHALAVNMEGYIMETRAFTVPICGEVELSVDLKAAGPVQTTEEEDYSEDIEALGEGKKKPKRKINFGIPHYIAFSLAGAAAITAAVTGGLALKTSNEFADKKDDYEAGDQGAYGDLKDLKDKGRPLAIVSDVTIGVAAVAAVTGIALLFIGPKESKDVSVLPVVSPKGGGASLNVNF
jgi:tetratricopeptide (TPR) repeat protein